MTTASPASSDTTTPSTPAPPAPRSVAVVGLGHQGLTHAALLSTIPGASLAAIVDPRRAVRDTARRVGFAAPAFRDLPTLLARARPDAVVVAGPQDERAKAARLALEAGCAVLSERPAAHRLEDAEALWALAEARGLPFAVAHPLGLLPVFARAQAALAADALGPLVQVRASIYRTLVFGRPPRTVFDPDRVVGGALAHLALDLLALLVWMVGTPVEVSATQPRDDGPIEDDLHGTMRLAGGVEVGLDTSWSMPGYPRAASVVEVVGENGTLLVSNEGCEVELREARGGWPAGATRQRDLELGAPARYDLDGEGLWLVDAAFLDALGGGAVPEALRAGRAAHRVMDAMYRSAREDGRVVAVAP